MWSLCSVHVLLTVNLFRTSIKFQIWTQLLIGPSILFFFKCFSAKNCGKCWQSLVGHVSKQIYPFKNIFKKTVDTLINITETLNMSSSVILDEKELMKKFNAGKRERGGKKQKQKT